MALFSLLNGFCTNYNAFIAMRALTGVGGGIISPNAVAIVTMMLPPGRTRNITIGFFAASAPIGGWLGALFSGLFVQLSNWQYLFFFKYAEPTLVRPLNFEFLTPFLVLPSRLPFLPHCSFSCPRSSRWTRMERSITLVPFSALPGCFCSTLSGSTSPLAILEMRAADGQLTCSTQPSPLGRLVQPL